MRKYVYNKRLLLYCSQGQDLQGAFSGVHDDVSSQGKAPQMATSHQAHVIDGRPPSPSSFAGQKFPPGMVGPGQSPIGSSVQVPMGSHAIRAVGSASRSGLPYQPPSALSPPGPPMMSRPPQTMATSAAAASTQQDSECQCPLFSNNLFYSSNEVLLTAFG